MNNGMSVWAVLLVAVLGGSVVPSLIDLVKWFVTGRTREETHDYDLTEAAQRIAGVALQSLEARATALEDVVLELAPILEWVDSGHAAPPPLAVERLRRTVAVIQSTRDRR